MRVCMNLNHYESSFYDNHDVKGSPAYFWTVEVTNDKLGRMAYFIYIGQLGSN
jgi:hypothetical protein